MNTWLLIYLFGWGIWALYLVEELSLIDFLASIIAGATWPISFPATVLRRLLPKKKPINKTTS